MGLLGGDLGLDLFDGRPGLGRLGVGLKEAVLHIHRIDLHQGLASDHVLIVGHQHLGHISGNLGRHGHLVGLQIGVVGRLLIAAVEAPVGIGAAAEQ